MMHKNAKTNAQNQQNYNIIGNLSYEISFLIY